MKKTIDYGLLVSVIAITLFGAYMILSATYYQNIFDESNNPLTDFNSDFQKIAIGFGVMIFAIFFKVKLIKKYSPLLMILTIFLLVATLIWGNTINGAKRWLMIGPMSFATAELAKLAGILFFAKVFATMTKSKEHYKWGWVSLLIFGGLSAGLIVAQQDLSTPFIYCVIIGVMLLVSGAKLHHVALLVMIGLISVSIMILSEPYRIARVVSLFSPSDDLLGDEAQANQSLMAIAEGGLLGVGAGEAYQTKNAHSQAESDMMFATVAETTGYVGAIALISTYVFMLWRLAKIAVSSQSIYSALVTTGVLTMIGLQAVVHLFVTTKLMPVTGVPLPFVSSGGTSIIILLGAIGIVLNLSSNPEGIG